MLVKVNIVWRLKALTKSGQIDLIKLDSVGATGVWVTVQQRSRLSLLPRRAGDSDLAAGLDGLDVALERGAEGIRQRVSRTTGDSIPSGRGLPDEMLLALLAGPLVSSGSH